MSMEAQDVFIIHDPPGMRERYAAFASGRTDPDMAGYACGAQLVAKHRIAYELFHLYAMEMKGVGDTEKVRKVKDWAYTEAAHFVSSRTRRNAVKGYRLDWGHQAARDGVCEALWGHVRGTGLAARSRQFGIGERPYQRIRDHIKKQAEDMINAFAKCIDAAIDLDAAIAIDSEYYP